MNLEPSHSGLHCGNATNVGHTVLIANQTLNLSGRPEWIQHLSLEDLKIAENRLHRAGMRHEACLLYTSRCV